MDTRRLREEFIERFAARPRLFRAPGRVNLIGEHTDYNAGFVMPAALQFQTTVAVAPRADRRLRIRSVNLAGTRDVELPEPGMSPRATARELHWSDYVLGVAWALQEHGVPVGGADLLIEGDLPLGAGLSSSASLEAAVAWALCAHVDMQPDGLTLARICQRAENDYVGMRCGIMDPFAAIMGRRGHALMIDCRSLAHRLLPLEPDPAGTEAPPKIVICNTMVRHQLAGSQYNRRREECEEGVRVLASVDPAIEALRDVSADMLERHSSRLDATIYRRCRHVVTENARVAAAAEALARARLTEFGRLMRASHRSLRDDYEVSCDELDLMVRLADSVDGVYGARMTGGGFGGCTVNLVRPDALAHFRSVIAAGYAAATGRAPEIYVCEAADGAGPVHP